MRGKGSDVIDHRDIDAERARRWRSLLNGDVTDLAVGRHARDSHVPAPPPLAADPVLLGNREGDRRALKRARGREDRWARFEDSATFDVLLALACGALLLALCVGLVLLVAYTLAWSLT